MAETKTASAKESETNKDRFERIAPSRVNRILRHLKILKNCAGQNYEYTDGQVVQMFEAIEKATQEAKIAFKKEQTDFDFTQE